MLQYVAVLVPGDVFGVALQRRVQAESVPEAGAVQQELAVVQPFRVVLYGELRGLVEILASKRRCSQFAALVTKEPLEDRLAGVQAADKQGLDGHGANDKHLRNLKEPKRMLMAVIHKQ